jgi:hypothetical protein
MGLYGDSNPNYYIAEYTDEYMDEHFVQSLVGASESEFDAWEGYGSQLSCVDADAVGGATYRPEYNLHAEKSFPVSCGKVLRRMISMPCARRCAFGMQYGR